MLHQNSICIIFNQNQMVETNNTRVDSLNQYPTQEGINVVEMSLEEFIAFYLNHPEKNFIPAMINELTNELQLLDNRSNNVN